MSVSLSLHRLTALQNQLRDVVERHGEETVRRQYHGDLSPLAWHLRHCTFVESFWIAKTTGDTIFADDDLASQCMPEYAPKDVRAAALPSKNDILSWANALMAENRALLSRLHTDQGRRGRLDSRYLAGFLVRHHGQHLEAIGRVLTERQCAADAAGGTHRVAHPLTPRGTAPAWREVAKGRRRIGAHRGFAFDNETPARRVTVPGFSIAARPVSNAEYLGFMSDNGYETKYFWSPAGWRWRTGCTLTHPHAWRKDSAGAWYEFEEQGAHDLDPDVPVKGINRFEAGAFARWAGARLPHEYEWETARRCHLLDAVGEVWEWCANAFHPYPGFTAFPYRGYSAVWFDGRHMVLRGGSRLTQPENKSASFRNYYPAQDRHIWAGLRLAF